jgi:hypothetical protein
VQYYPIRCAGKRRGGPGEAWRIGVSLEDRVERPLEPEGLSVDEGAPARGVVAPAPAAQMSGKERFGNAGDGQRALG